MHATCSRNQICESFVTLCLLELINHLINSNLHNKVFTDYTYAQKERHWHTNHTSEPWARDYIHICFWFGFLAHPEADALLGVALSSMDVQVGMPLFSWRAQWLQTLWKHVSIISTFHVKNISCCANAMLWTFCRRHHWYLCPISRHSFPVSTHTHLPRASLCFHQFIHSDDRNQEEDKYSHAPAHSQTPLRELDSTIGGWLEWHQGPDQDHL